MPEDERGFGGIRWKLRRRRTERFDASSRHSRPECSVFNGSVLRDDGLKILLVKAVVRA